MSGCPNNHEEWISNRTTGVSEDEIYNREHPPNIQRKKNTNKKILKNAMHKYTVWSRILVP